MKPKTYIDDGKPKSWEMKGVPGIGQMVTMPDGSLAEIRMVTVHGNEEYGYVVTMTVKPNTEPTIV